MLAVALLSVTMTGSGLAQTGEIYQIGNGVTSPRLIKEVKPKYTKAAMDRKLEGMVEVEAVILRDGTVGDVTVTKSLDEELDQEAVTATKQWRFTPGTREGKAVAVRVQIELTFTLRNE